ncbi:uncharacterized protein TNCV_3823441 [Trichonephila clavipes]|nr:uncharacterized protein TNCV_3823441 [Trichonephila clavipes]
MSCKSSAEDAELGTVQVSQQPVELPDIQHDVDAELGTALVSQQLCEPPHTPPVLAFTVRLVHSSTCLHSSACSQFDLPSQFGNVSLNLATFLARAK